MTESTESLSALPSVTVRVVAFVSILLGGLAGGLLGIGLVGTQCSGSCAPQNGVGMFVGSVLFAGGTAIVAVLVLRVHGEWRQMSDPS